MCAQNTPDQSQTGFNLDFYHQQHCHFLHDQTSTRLTHRTKYFEPPMKMWYLHSERLNVVGSVGAPCKVGEIKLNLIPPLVKVHRHRTDEGLYPRGALQATAGGKVRPAQTTSNDEGRNGWPLV